MPSSLAPRLTTAFTLTGSPAAAAASIPSRTFCTGKSTSFSALECGVVDRVEAHGHPVEASLCERLGLLLEQRAVRRQRELETRNRVQQLDEALDVAPDERLAAGDPHEADAQALRRRS